MRYHSDNPAVLVKVFKALAEGVKRTTDKELACSVVAEVTPLVLAALKLHCTRRDLSYEFFLSLANQDSFQVALAATGGIPLIFAAMKHHRADRHVCQYGCLIVSQIVSRDAAYKDTVKAAGGVAFAHATMTSWPDGYSVKSWATGLITALK